MSPTPSQPCWVNGCAQPATHTQEHSGETLHLCEDHWRTIPATMKLGADSVRH